VFRSGGKVSFDNTNHLEEPEPTLADLDIDFTKVRTLIGASESAEPEETPDDPQAFAKRFKKEFYGRLNQSYRFYNEIFRLVTAGQVIDAAVLIADLDQQFYSPEGQINPAQALIDKFVTGGWWTFTDAEFKPALEKLLDYCKGGDFGNPVSYLNAFVFLIGFKQVIGKTEDEIITEIKEGLDKYFARISYNHFIETQFDMSRSHFTGEHAKKLIAYMKDGFKQLQQNSEKTVAAALEQLFIHDLNGFVKETLHPTSHIRTPYEPIFNFFSNDALTKGIKEWQPSGIMDLASLMEIRYNSDTFLERLRDEQPFLEHLKAVLSSVSNADKPLSSHLIQKELIPKIDRAVMLLKTLPQPENDVIESSE